MGKFNKNNNKRSDRRDSDRRDFGRSDRRGAHGSNRRDSSRRDFGRSNRREPLTMHPAVCDECKKDCEVPFKPTSSKPIYCSDCFKKKDRSKTNNSEQCEKELAQINEKLDKILEALESK